MTALPRSNNFTVYFDFDDAEFDMNQIGVVQEACGYAGTLPPAEFILSGYADTVGPEPYNDGLSLSRAQSVAAVIRNDPRFRDALHLIKFGKRDLAVPTMDEVAEPKNRRVVVTVVPGEFDQAIVSSRSRIPAALTNRSPKGFRNAAVMVRSPSLEPDRTADCAGCSGGLSRVASRACSRDDHRICRRGRSDVLVVFV